MTFAFHEGERVTLRQDKTALGLRAGETGIVWAQYATAPPSYEVTFARDTADELSLLLYEDELTSAPLPLASKTTAAVSG